MILAGGYPLSFPRLKANIKKASDPKKLIIEIALFLRESDEVNNEQWRKLSQRFFREYRDIIMQYFGYDKPIYDLTPRVVKYPRFFITLMAVLLKLEVFECNTTELVNSLCAMFSFGKESSTIRKWFYDSYPEYDEFLTKFKELFGTIINKK